MGVGVGKTVVKKIRDERNFSESLMQRMGRRKTAEDLCISVYIEMTGGRAQP